MFDTIIVGGGPAGLSAALVLGRCRRRVLLCDAGRPRNARAHQTNGFFTRDGTKPAELRRLGREQVAAYDNVEILDVEVTDAGRLENGFQVTLSDDTHHRSRTLLLATGVVDELPEIEGFEPLYGQSIFHCPYCDGWEQRDQPIAIYGRGQQGKGLALELTAWSEDLILCTDGPADLASHDLERLAANGIRVREERITRLEGCGGKLECVRFDTGEGIPRRALFFISGERQASGLALKLGCKLTRNGAIETGSYERTEIPGLYVAGDASRYVQLVVVAASEGAKAAFAINTELLKQDLK